MNTPQPDFAAHRAAVLERLADDEALLVFGGPLHHRNGDAEFRYRAHSDVYWLTGWRDPEVAVFLRPGEAPVTMFVQPKNEAAEIWTGRRAGPKGAVGDFGANEAFSFEELSAELPRLLQGVRTLHYGFADQPAHDQIVMKAVRTATRAARYNGSDVPETFHRPSLLLHDLRLRKNPAELDMLRHAAAATVKAHIACMQAGRPGVNEAQLDALLDYTFRTEGGDGPGYTNIVAAGVNATILHYIENRSVIQDGELVLIDAGCEFGLYTADVTRTWPANGTFSPAQRDLYDVVLAAQHASFAACRVGSTFTDVHHASVETLAKGMLDLGLLTGTLDEVLETKSYKRFYMHGTSHWLGLDVHDVGRYGKDGRSRGLEPGMVLTVEPGLYIQPGDMEAPEAFRGIGIRIEDDVHITAGEPEILTAAVPTNPDAIEALIER